MNLVIGQSVPRKEGLSKILGRAEYVADRFPDGSVFGVTVRSAVPHGRILAIHYEGGVPWDEVTIVTAKDITGPNFVALLVQDQPCLADNLIRHAMEPVVLLAHPDRDVLERARAAVRIEVEPLPPVLSIDDALSCAHVLSGTKDNVLKEFRIEKGSLAQAEAEADRIIVGTYETGAQEHLYIEPNGVIAFWEHGKLTVEGSIQCPYYVQKALLSLFGLSPANTRVVQRETGGGFGGKEEYPSILACHAALLAQKAKKPVVMLYDREEDMRATTKRHPSRTVHTTYVRSDGTILGMDIDFVLDAGGYTTLSPVVLSRGAIHAAGPYEVPHVRVRARAVATCHPPTGAFRGFGAPQSLFALERHMDRVAAELGLSPVELRNKNLVGKGGTLATGQVVRDDIDMRALLDRALRESQYLDKRDRFARENAGSSIKRGIGLACFMHGTGFTGNGEKYLSSVAGVALTPEGNLSVRAASTEIGQGTNTVFAQIAAEAAGIPYDQVEVHRPDTDFVPNSGPTVASRTCTIVGKLVETSTRTLVAKMREGGYLPETYDGPSFARAAKQYRAEHGDAMETATYTLPPHVVWDEVAYRGDAYATFSWAVYVAEVSVDTTTYEARVEDFVALQEVGRVVHPLLAHGQIEGGVAQGIGWTLYENVVAENGIMQNARFTDYIIPTAVDLPRIRVLFEEAPYDYGPGGAKGIGELPMDGPAPAILNAIHHAVGVSLDRIPVTPEALFRASARASAP